MKKISTYALGGFLVTLTLSTVTSCEPDHWYDDWGGGDGGWYGGGSYGDDGYGDSGHNSDNHGGNQGGGDQNGQSTTVSGCWQGKVNYYNNWEGHTYTSSEIEFYSDTNNDNSGSGYWVDYYDGFNSNYYVYNKMTWTATNDALTITLVQENSTFTIYNYCFSDTSFDGTIYYNNNPITFSLTKINSPIFGTWDKYTPYSPTSGTTDSGTTTPSDSTSVNKSNTKSINHITWKRTSH